MNVFMLAAILLGYTFPKFYSTKLRIIGVMGVSPAGLGVHHPVCKQVAAQN